MFNKTHNQKTKRIIGTMLGNALDFYDLILFGVFSPIISALFFPSSKPYLSITATFASFAIGFIFRPLGSLYFGQIADKFGRKKALSNSIFLMAFATGVIGILPTHQHIGIAAPILITFMRCIQGFAAGGEYNSSAIFLLESTAKSKGMVACLLTASGVVGSLAATLFLNLSLYPGMPSWIWRIAFLFGSTVGLLGLYIRLKLEESIEFNNVLKEGNILANPLLKVLALDRVQLLISFGIGSFNGIIYYFQFVYLNIYFNSFLKIPLHESNFFTTLGLIFYMLFLLLNGMLSDKFGAKKIMSISCVCFILFIQLIIHYLSTKDKWIIIACEICLSYMNASFCGLKHAFLFNLFPPNRRCTGVSIGYSLGLAIFGGITPLLMNLLNINFNIYIGGLYIVFWAIICLLLINYDSIVSVMWWQRFRMKSYRVSAEVFRELKDKVGIL